jgi:hypothetical protein
LYLQLLDLRDQRQVFADEWTHQAKIAPTIFADERLFVKILKTERAFHCKITVGGGTNICLTALSECESTVQLGQLALQCRYALLELCIFGCQRFWNF